MPSRLLPRTEAERLDALSGVWRKLASSSVPERALLRLGTQKRLRRVLPRFRRAVRSRQDLRGSQTEGTAAVDQTREELRIYLAHFLQALNHCIQRGKGFRAGDRTYYGLHASQETLPRMRTLAEIIRVATDVVTGEAERTAAGGSPITLPSATEIAELLERLQSQIKARKQILHKTEPRSNAVIGMREEVDDLIRDIWDELDFAFRKEPAPSKRRRLREWGVAFESRPARKAVPQAAGEELPGSGTELPSSRTASRSAPQRDRQSPEAPNSEEPIGTGSRSATGNSPVAELSSSRTASRSALPPAPPQAPASPTSGPLANRQENLSSSSCRVDVDN